MLSEVTSAEEVFRQFEVIANSLDFEFCAYGTVFPLPLTRPAAHIFNNYPPQWWNRYQERGYLEIDPTVRHALKSTLPIVWSDSFFAEAPELWEDARNHGLEFGVAQPVRDANGAVGLITLARNSRIESPKEIQTAQMNLAWIAQFIHTAMMHFLKDQLAPESAVELTIRERDVLRWTADGKTSYEISMILGVAERTVNYHINNTIIKLKASNKTHATAKAIALGLAFP